MTYPIKFDPTVEPPPLMTGEPGSFAYSTLVTRKPAIIKNVIADHQDQYAPEILRALTAFLEEITQDQPVQPLRTTAPDAATWQTAWQRIQGRTWLNIPWYFAEAFFYRRLLEITGYFGRGAGAGLDPFLPRKLAELHSDAPWQILHAALDHSRDSTPESLAALLQHSVWGNRVDLSYTKVAQDAGRQISLRQEQSNLLVDDTPAVLAHLARSAARIDFICDNAGTELLLDLALVDFLLRFNRAAVVTLHVKAHPTFVSDTIPADVDMTLTAMKTRQPAPAHRLETFLGQKRLRLAADYFWNSPHFFWQMPPALHAELAQARLVIIKGDANYRRLLGDSRWPATAAMADLVPYFPAPFAALRTMKSDPVAGLPPGLAEALDGIDPQWRVNGKRGLIQAVLRPAGLP